MVELPTSGASGQTGGGQIVHDESKATTGELPNAEAGYIIRAEPPPAYDEGQVKATAAPPSSSYVKPSARVSTPGDATASPANGPRQMGKDERIIWSALFWITAGLGWVVWIFSVSAAADQNWIENSEGDTYGARSNEFKEGCEAVAFFVDSVCMPYDFFSTSQILSTILCSVAVVLYTMAFFRPAEAPHGSAQALGLVGGILMTITAFSQMLAFLFVDMAIREYDEILAFVQDNFSIDTTEDDAVFSHGPTYAVGIIAFILSAINAIIVFVSYRHAGDGPVLRCAKAVSHTGMVNTTAG